MLEQLFRYVAMALDTLPEEGRIVLLALLLAITLCALATRMPDELGSRLNVMYRKGALVSMLAAPLLVYILGVQMPVYVDEVSRFNTSVPFYLTVAFSVVWGLGAAVHVWRLWGKVAATIKVVATSDYHEPSSKLVGRVTHWCRRLNQVPPTHIWVGGGERPWHLVNQGGQIVLPAAAANWPVGVVDVMLLQQLAQLKQRAWLWSLFGALVAAIYWPLPWVKRLADQLSEHFSAHAGALARAAYRDHDGWRRDTRNMANRGETLAAHNTPGADGLFRLPSVDWVEGESPAHPSLDMDDSFDKKWALTKHRRAERHRDPYEQAYWLIAVACLLVGVATTLTVVQTPPEFEPRFLQVKWQDQMGRRIKETGSQGEPQAE